jgi:membrane-associated phospholipid phosphatase
MQRRPATAAAVGLAGVGGLLLVWLLAFHSARIHAADLTVFEGFYHLHHGRMAVLTDPVPHLSDPPLFVLWFLLIVGTAIARGRPRLALAAGVVLLGANLTTHLLKPALGDYRYSDGAFIGAGSWPSGHATASMAVALCAVLVVPARLRPAVSALAAVFTLAVCFSLLVDGWHFPSDVVAGYLMAGTWTAFGVAAVWASERRWPVRAGRPVRLHLADALAPALAVAAAGAALFLLVTLARPAEVTEYARAHTTFVIGAGLIAALALSLVAALTAVMTTTSRAAAEPPTPVPGGGPAPTGARRPR